MKGTWGQRWRRQALVGVVLLAALTAFSPTSRSEAGTITGTVKDEAGAAITDVAVTAVKIGDNTETAATIDADGITYTLDSLVDGTYNLKFSGDGHIMEWYEDAPMQDCATPLPVTADSSTTADAVLAVVDKGSISGTVTGAGGNGVGDVTVRAQNTSTGSSYEATTSLVDPIGSYTISVPVGTYKVEFQAPDTENLLDEWFNDTAEATATDVVVAKDATTEDINAALTVGAIISGTVTDSAEPSNNVPGAWVAAFCGSDEPSDDGTGWILGYTGHVTTNDTGAYEIVGLPPGNCKVLFKAPDSENLLDEWNADQADFDSADVVEVVAGETDTVDAALAVGGIISGAVTEAVDGTTPVVGGRVYVYKSDNSDNEVQYEWTDGTGAYEIVGLPTGSYKVLFRAPFNENLLDEWNADQADFDSADVVEVVAGETDTVDAALAVGGIITGTVTGPDGSPVEDVDVSVAKASVSGSVNFKYTDENGKYTLQGLPAGDYKMYFNPKSYGSDLSPEWYDDKEGTYTEGFANADVISVTAGESQTIDAQLAKGGSISGTVTKDEAIFKCAYVNLYQSGLPINESGYYYPLKGRYTDYQGNYTFKGLATSSYKLKFFDNDSDPSYQWYNRRAAYKCATKVSVAAPNETTGIDATWPVQLQQCGNLIPKILPLLLNN